jgi:hypothetical protein
MTHFNELLEGKIFTIPNFLLDKECDMFINGIINKQDIVNFTSVSGFKNDKYIDVTLSSYFYGKIVDVFGVGLVNKLGILKANTLIMTGMYGENQQFGLHTDTGLYYNKIDREKSRFTLLIYLNDDYENGGTAFYDDNFVEMLEVEPERGMALLFDIDLWHKGNEVVGGCKYWIGCEVVGRF